MEDFELQVLMAEPVLVTRRGAFAAGTSKNEFLRLYRYDWSMRILRALARSERHREQLLAYWILSATLGIMLATVWHSLSGEGVLAAWDAGGHLLKAQYFANELLPQGHLSGWFPTWHGGFDLFQFYPPLLYYLLGPLTLLMNDELALRVVTAGLWLSLVPVTYYFLRSFSLNRLVAAFGTSFLLALNASFGIGLGALYGVGLLPNGLGFILAIWLLGRLKRDLSEPARGKYQFVLSGLLLGLLLLAHTFSAYWWLLASLVLAATELYPGGERLRRVGKRYGFILLVGLLVSAYWWIPLALNLENMGPTGAIQQSPRLEILSALGLSQDSGGIVMSLLAAAGLAYLAVRRQLRTLAFFVGLGVLSLLLALNTINNLLPFSSIIGSSQFIRFQAFFSWLLMALAAFGAAGIWYLLRRIRIPYLPHAIFGAILAAVFLFVVLPTLDEKRGFVRAMDNSPVRELDDLAAYLNGTRKPGEFILSEFNWESRFYFGSPHFVNQRLPGLVDDSWDLQGNFPEGTVGATKALTIASTLEQTEYLLTQREYLQSRGVRFIVTTHPATRAGLRTVPWLRQTWQGTVLSVFELTDYAHAFGLPATAGPQVSGVSYQAPGRYEVSFAQPVSLASGTSLALSYHPWLRVSADGRPIATREDLEHRLELNEDASDVRTLTVDYQPAGSAKAAGVLSILAILAVVVLLLRPTWLEALVARTNGTIRRPRRGKGRPKRPDAPSL